MLIKSVSIPTKLGVEKKDILISEQGTIEKIAEQIGAYGDKKIEASEYYVVPGFIDVHTHGFNGHVSESDSSGLKEMAKRYAERGTLGFCPTVGPRPLDEYVKIVEDYKEAFDGAYEGARFLGLHLEGPYLNPRKAGAISPESMYAVQLEELENFLKRVKGYIKIMSIAPETAHAEEAIRLLKKYGVIPSAGHTYATYEEMEKAVSAGVNHATHTYNAMRELSHKTPGILEAVLLNDNIYSELVADGVHVSKPAMEILLRLKGKDKVIAISDGGATCGVDYEDGYTYEDGFSIRKGAVYTPSGILCGSTKDVYRHFKFFVDEMGCTIYEAMKLTSMNAAVHLGLDFGRIEEGLKGNLLLLDKEFGIRHVIINGQLLK